MKMNQIQIPNKFKNISEKEIKQVALAALLKLDVDNSLIEIESIDKEGISKLNFEYRSKNEATDVLSFPLKSTPGENNLLGNIFICEEVAEDRGENLLELVKHGILHLVGADHETDQDSWETLATKINHKM